MRIFITGGTGFLGGHLVPRLLKDGHELLILSRDPSKSSIDSRWREETSFVEADAANITRQERRIKTFRAEVSIHLAWEGIPSDASEFDIHNLLNGLRVIETCIRAGTKTIVMAGSCHEYGEPGGKVTEASSLRPYNALYATKIALYWLGAKMAAERNVNFIWLRPGFIYGPGQRRKSLIPHMVDTWKRGESLALRTPSGGNDFVYVDDVVDAFAKTVKNYKKIGTSVYNVGSGRLTPVAEVVRRVYDELGFEVPREFRKNPGKIDGFWMDIAKIKRELHWMPHTSLREGIQKTVAYFKAH
jgi:dTDP-6-deoxy-L-talose 4-dehydrogenase (NAD+)